MDINNLSKIILEYSKNRDFITDTEIIALTKTSYPDFNESFKNILISMLMNKKVIYSYNFNIYKRIIV